jgi:hypothetical protein
MPRYCAIMGVWADRSAVRGGAADAGGVEVGSVIEPKMLGQQGRAAGCFGSGDCHPCAIGVQSVRHPCAIRAPSASAPWMFAKSGGIRSLPRTQTRECEGMVE